jgi:catechol 2,3-dioxygenase-like lactoylglutathione lyase family enzyme
MERPAMEISGPTLDAADPAALARFYSRLLGWPVVAEEGPRPGCPPQDAWIKIRDPASRLKMEFQWDEHYDRPAWPSAPGRQLMMMHLDIAVDDLRDGVAWALEVGAELAPHQPQEGVRVLLDPEGHPFCLFATTGEDAGRR